MSGAAPDTEAEAAGTPVAVDEYTTRGATPDADAADASRDERAPIDAYDDVERAVRAKAPKAEAASGLVDGNECAVSATGRCSRSAPLLSARRAAQRPRPTHPTHHATSARRAARRQKQRLIEWP